MSILTLAILAFCMGLNNKSDTVPKESCTVRETREIKTVGNEVHRDDSGNCLILAEEK